MIFTNSIKCAYFASRSTSKYIAVRHMLSDVFRIHSFSNCSDNNKLSGVSVSVAYESVYGRFHVQASQFNVRLFSCFRLLYFCPSMYCLLFGRAFNCRILYGLYLLTIILTMIWYSITHSLFHSWLKTFLFCKSYPPQPFLFYFRIHYMDFTELQLLLFLSSSSSLVVVTFFNKKKTLTTAKQQFGN